MPRMRGRVRSSRTESKAISGWIRNLLDDPDAQWPGSNALWTPAMGVAAHDPALAACLVESVLDRYGDPESGLIMDGNAAASACPLAAWPLWCGVALYVYRQGGDKTWGRRIYSALRRNLLAATEYFDPEHHGLACWQSAEEAWRSDDYHPRVATPDLLTLLVREADALVEFRSVLDIDATDERVADERTHWVGGLLDYLADPEAGCFSARRIGGGRLPVSVDLAVFPLLWRGLPGEWVSPLVKFAQDGLMQALASRTGPVAILERRLWSQALRRVDALGLADQLKGLAPPDGTDDVIGHVYTAWMATRRGCRETRSLAAGVCLLLALGWGIRGREPVYAADDIDLRSASLVLSALREDYRSDPISSGFVFDGLPQSFRDWQRAVLAEIGGDWDRAAVFYRRHDEAVGGSVTARFGLARVLSRSADTLTLREVWEAFLDLYGESFPDAATVARELWWHAESRNAPSWRRLEDR